MVWLPLLFIAKQIPGGGGKEIAQVGNPCKERPHASRLEVELLLVVGIDEPEGALQDGEAGKGCLLLETFDGHARGSYVHQFAYVTCRGSAHFQQAFVEWLWQQMDEWKHGGKTDADLLMTAERVLPSWKAKEDDAALSEEGLDVKHEGLFVNGLDMFYHIVNKNKVVALRLALWLFCKDEVLANERALSVVLPEKSAAFIDALLIDVYACHLASLFRERKQIAALATAYFQNARGWRQRDVRLQVVPVEFVCGVCQLAEVQSAVQMSLLHRLFLFCFSIGIDTTKQEKTALLQKENYHVMRIPNGRENVKGCSEW